MIVVNLFGEPGAGKSTCAAYVFSQLKMRGVNAELITEFAKDKTWEKNFSALKNQAYMFGEQWYRITCCENDVDVIVTDSPILLNILYNDNIVLGESFNKVVENVFKSYNNKNYLLYRVKEYNPKGRNQTEEEAHSLGIQLRNILDNRDIPYARLPGNLHTADKIVESVLEVLDNECKSVID